MGRRIGNAKVGVACFVHVNERISYFLIFKRASLKEALFVWLELVYIRLVKRSPFDCYTAGSHITGPFFSG